MRITFNQNLGTSLARMFERILNPQGPRLASGPSRAPKIWDQRHRGATAGEFNRRILDNTAAGVRNIDIVDKGRRFAVEAKSEAVRITPRLLAAAFFSVFALFANAAVINFDDGLTSPTQPGGTAVGSFYSGAGFTSPNLRFHDSAYVGNVPFNFKDDWGAVVDFGALNSNVGIIHFNTPVRHVRLSAIGQSSFGLNGAEPFSWSIVAYDTANNQIGLATETFGFDFAGAPNPPNVEPYPLARLDLSIQGSGLISRLEFSSDSKIGVDTLFFDSAGGNSPVPDSGSTAGLCLISVGVVLAFRRGQRRD